MQKGIKSKNGSHTCFIWPLEMKYRKVILFQVLLLFFVPHILLSQAVTLKWLPDDVLLVGKDNVEVAAFEGGQYIDGSFFPYYVYSRKLTKEEGEHFEYDVSISNLSFSAAKSTALDDRVGDLSVDFEVISHVASARRQYTLEVFILPLKAENGKVSRLEEFELNIQAKPKPMMRTARSAAAWFVNKSVLADGNWTKVAVKKTGIYKLTYNQLAEMGVRPESVAVFTTTPGKLPTMIQDYVDDLVEIPIYDADDYILFYAQSQDVWNYDATTNKYVHTLHPFWNENYLFITSDAGEKKRIKPRPLPEGISTKTYTSFVDYDFFDAQDHSIANSGQDWHSPKILDGEVCTHTFSFPDITDEQGLMTMKLAARSIQYETGDYGSHVMTTYIDDYLQENITLPEVKDNDGALMARQTTRHYTFTPTSNNITAKMAFQSAEKTANGFVDYFTVEVKRKLKFNGKSLLFRNKPMADTTLVTYRLSEVSSLDQIWDLTNGLDVKSIPFSSGGTELSFKAESHLPQEFVALNTAADFPSPVIVGKVENQNIHGMATPNMVIITPREFIEVAEELAEVRRSEGLDVFVTTQDKIFNEFSGGKPDVTAIRWLMKMFYDRSEAFKYLLLFGDGDVNNRLYEDASSLVMTYQSVESLKRSEIYVSDDYFGLLDDDEGDETKTNTLDYHLSNIERKDRVDIGIGRIPIRSVAEGKIALAKIKHYKSNLKRTAWKNRVCILADDADNNTHVNHADELAEKIRAEHQGMAVKKVYLDAFNRIKESSTYLYPDAKKLSDQYLDEGVLIWGYSGHGSPKGLSAEKLIYLSDFDDMKNLSNLPLWVTATCDFCPYDHNDEVSAGERVLFNPAGGGIALFTTTRLVYASHNLTITKKFYSYILNTDSNGDKLRLGDVICLTKKDIGTDANKRKFCLIGDPSLRLVYPDERWSVETDSINYQHVDKYEHPFLDTIKALSIMTISGYIAGADGAVDNDFNGVLYPTVYDKISTLKTLANETGDNGSQVKEFKLWDAILFNGKTEVENGRFKFSFLLPKDIKYTAGKGRIEYYATSEEVEANGFYENFHIGGFDQEFEQDTVGPEIKAYLNSSQFRNGDVVGPDPMLVAEIKDESGINTSGTSIGHDIMITLDKDPNTVEVINSAYTTHVGTYKEGRLSYQMKNLPEGDHTLTLRMWDMQNNSTSKTISFVVREDAPPEISHLYCFPNPYSISEGTTLRFSMEHDRPEKTLHVTLNVFDGAGRLVHATSEYAASSSNEVYFDWNPTESFLNAGVYFYRITIDDDRQVSTGKTEKLLLLP